MQEVPRCILYGANKRGKIHPASYEGKSTSGECAMVPIQIKHSTNENSHLAAIYTGGTPESFDIYEGMNLSILALSQSPSHHQNLAFAVITGSTFGKKLKGTTIYTHLINRNGHEPAHEQKSGLIWGSGSDVQGIHIH